MPFRQQFCFVFRYYDVNTAIQFFSLSLSAFLSFALCVRRTYADSQLNYSYTSNFMGRRVQNNRIWPFLLLLLVFISFLIAWLWFHYSFRRLAHYFSFIQLSCDWVCAIRSPLSLLISQQCAYAQIIKNAYNVMPCVCVCTYATRRITHRSVNTNDSIVGRYFCMFDCNKRCDNNNKISKHTYISSFGGYMTSVYDVHVCASVRTAVNRVIRCKMYLSTDILSKSK